MAPRSEEPDEYIEMEIIEPCFSLIQKGLKTIEGRKMSDKWIGLTTGDFIKVTCPSREPFFVRIVDIHYYPSTICDSDPLLLYLQEEGLERTLPGVYDFDVARDIYLQWSSQEEINLLGFMAIHIELL